MGSIQRNARQLMQFLEIATSPLGRRGRRLFFAGLAVFGPVAACLSQHTDDNPVTSASDGFGLTIGLESIGIYNPTDVRGFSPQVAGNLRIDGLYFDQQAPLSDRVVEGSTIRVGVSEIGYPFPAPTGIVDYELRNPGDGKASATMMMGVGPFEGRFVNVDATVPLLGGQLLLPIGVSYQVGASQPGYTAHVANFGASPQWKPNDRITIRAFFDWQRTTGARTLPYYFPEGDFEPPTVKRGYYGQDWAEGQSLSENFGAIAEAKLAGDWSVAAGLFRSVANNPVSFADLYVNVLEDGQADHLLVGYPDQRVGSTSGEVRLTDHISYGPWNSDLIFLARGRDTEAFFGGADVVDAGEALITEHVQVPEPAFSYTARTRDVTNLWSAGMAYRGQWDAHGELTLGLQREDYRDAVTEPGGPNVRLADRPWRAYGDVALYLPYRTIFYAGFVQGLEDSGVAPNNAENRGAILPAAETWQYDAGFRFLLGSSVKVTAGYFDVNKPYFNIDTANVDRALGTQSAAGLEFSIAGEVAKNLNLVAGAVIGQVTVTGPNLAAEGIGSQAFGQPRVYYVVDADYGVPWWKALSVDIEVSYYGTAAYSLDGKFFLNPLTQINVGGRYKFRMFNAPASLRFQVQNALNFYDWSIFNSPGYSQWAPKAYLAYLTVDF
jgi:iron complex outermembrane recepter protein